MKPFYLPLIIVFLLISSCKKDSIADETEFNKSYTQWLSFKSTAHNTYLYTTTVGSWTGYGAEIKTGVVNGKVAWRDFVSTQLKRNGTSQKDTLKQWHEDTDHLNTHPNDAGESLTLDDVYQKAKTVWLKADKKTNDIYLETKNDGMISSCGFVPKGCQDDCFNGITISLITPVQF